MSLFMFRPGTKVFAITKKTKRRRPMGVPQLLEHKVRDRVYGYALFGGVRRSYGPLDDEARRLFDEDRQTWFANGENFPPEPEPEPLPEVEAAPATVAELAARYREHVKTEHDPAWHKRNEKRIVYATDVLVELNGAQPAADFGPRKLKALQAHLCDLKRKDDKTPRLTVKTVNERVRTIVAAFAWAVSDELLPTDVLTGLRAVAAVRKGKPGTRASRKVDPVAREHYDAVLPFLNKPVRALVELLWHTGARPGELFGLRPQDIDRSETPWVARLADHKTAWKGKRRAVFFGTEARRVLEPFLLRPAARPLFSPREVMADSMRRRRAARETTLWDAHKARYERERAARSRQTFGDTYDAKSLRKAILRAVRLCNDQRAREGLDMVPAWFPYALRHSAATRIRAAHGIEAARVLLGHTSAGMTEVYAEADLQHAAKVAEQAG